MTVVSNYSGHYVDNEQAIREAVESRLLTLVTDLRPYSFEFRGEELDQQLEARIRAALKPDIDWYTIIDIQISPGLIELDLKALREG